MQRVIINMCNHILSSSIEQMLDANGDVHATIVDKPEEVAQRCVSLAVNVLLVEAAGYSPYLLEERLELCAEVKRRIPLCKAAVLVDENADKELTARVKRAKLDGLIDQFIFSSTSASYLVALLDTL